MEVPLYPQYASLELPEDQRADVRVYPPERGEAEKPQVLVLTTCHSDMCDGLSAIGMELTYVDIIAGRPALTLLCSVCGESKRIFPEVLSRVTLET